MVGYYTVFGLCYQENNLKKSSFCMLSKGFYIYFTYIISVSLIRVMPLNFHKPNRLYEYSEKPNNVD